MSGSQKYNDDNLLEPEFLEQLKQERISRGISKSEVAEKTNIREVYIDAIENNEFHRLPGGVYNKAYVRSISEYLGIRPSIAEIVRSTPEAERNKIAQPEIDPTRYEIIPNKLIVIASVIGIIFVYGIYAAVTSKKPSEIKTAEETTSPAEHAATEAATPVAETVKPVETPATVNPDVTISIVAIGNSKVKLTTANGDVILDKPMKYGETRILAGEDNLLLTVDAPQNIEIYLDGTYAGSSSNLPLETGSTDKVKIQVAELLKKISRN